MWTPHLWWHFTHVTAKCLHKIVKYLLSLCFFSYPQDNCVIISIHEHSWIHEWMSKWIFHNSLQNEKLHKNTFTRRAYCRRFQSHGKEMTSVKTFNYFLTLFMIDFSCECFFCFESFYFRSHWLTLVSFHLHSRVIISSWYLSTALQLKLATRPSNLFHSWLSVPM